MKQNQLILLRCFKTLGVGPVWESNQGLTLRSELTSRTNPAISMDTVEWTIKARASMQKCCESCSIVTNMLCHGPFQTGTKKRCIILNEMIQLTEPHSTTSATKLSSPNKVSTFIEAVCGTSMCASEGTNIWDGWAGMAHGRGAGPYCGLSIGWPKSKRKHCLQRPITLQTNTWCTHPTFPMGYILGML